VALRTAIVTGGARGIGRAISLGLATAGFNVVVADLDYDVLDDVSRAVRPGAGVGGILPVRADISKEQDIDQLVQRAVAAFGGVDVIVNNAGPTQTAVRPFGKDDPILFQEVPPDLYRLFLETHVMGPFMLTRAALPYLRMRGWGRVITITTSLGTMISGGRMPYGPAKAANEAQMSVMAADLEGTGITVNVVVPGAGVETRNTLKLNAANGPSNLKSPEIMVGPVLWLASDASDGVTSKRFVAVKWDNDASPETNLANAGAPIGWPGLQSLAPSS
jgi:NAD(P)-dependent dehydrogenase (short-subunit alcohol dehydrogenase family)